jgi:long-chain fatty acid transport protein
VTSRERLYTLRRPRRSFVRRLSRAGRRGIRRMRTRVSQSRRALKIACASAVWTALAVVLSGSSPLHAQLGAFGLYEVGLPNQGESYAGMAATADNAGTSYLNPAGMMRLKNTQLLFGAQMFDYQTHFRPESGTTVSGSDGGDAGGIYPAGGVYFVVKPDEDYRIGFSVNSPFGYDVRYEDDWVGRYFVQDWRFYTVDMRPSFAYRIDDQFSIGVGADVYYAYNSENIALKTQTPGLPDGSYSIETDTWALGWDAGLLYEFTPETRVGATYRNRTALKMKGQPTFDEQDPTHNPTFNSSRYDDRFALPAGVNVSLYHDFNPVWALLMDFGWTNWSAFDHEPTSLAPMPTNVARTWHDTYRGGIGARYRFAEHWMLQSGYSYESSPVNKDERTPDLPMDQQHRISIGVQHEVSKSVSWGAAYTFAYLGGAPIDRSLDATSGTLDGHYSPNQLQTVSLTFSFGF